MDCQKSVKNIRNELKEYIQSHKIKALILGISGGIDSALCAALARPVCDELGIPLIGRSLPMESNKDNENSRAISIGKSFCTDFEVLEMEPALRGFCEGLGDVDEKKYFGKSLVLVGNIKARLRMIVLYDLAGMNRGLVLSTDNYTEYLLGYWTLHGDVGDYGMIQNLWKTEVYEMADYIQKRHGMFSDTVNRDKSLAIESCIKAVPTDGLGITEGDLDQLEAPSYKEVDRILQRYIALNGAVEWGDEEEKEYQELKKHPVIKRHERTHFKRKNPLNIPREVIFQ
jgi:nicotinamide-nucleotide amidase